MVDYIGSAYGIRLSPTFILGTVPLDPTIERLTTILSKFDAYTLASVFLMTSAMKSTALALYLMNDQCSVREAVALS